MLCWTLSPCPEWPCLWHINLHIDSLSILCIHWLFTTRCTSIHCHYFCAVSSEEHFTGKGCLSIHIGKKEKMIPSYLFQFKSISGPPDFIRPFKFTCCKHNHAHDLPIYVLAWNSWDGSSISHPSSASPSPFSFDQITLRGNRSFLGFITADSLETCRFKYCVWTPDFVSRPDIFVCMKPIPGSWWYSRNKDLFHSVSLCKNMINIPRGLLIAEEIKQIL